MNPIKAASMLAQFACFSFVLSACSSAPHRVDASEAAPDATHHNAAVEHTVCTGYGPQTPRDIDDPAGSNASRFSVAPSYEAMNLCNIHFHNGAEHKAKAFSISSPVDPEGHGGGFQCAISKSLTAAELKPADKKICKGLHPGDTVEVHWVYSSCDVAPGKGLEACSSATCANPDLRVETQVFTLVNDSSAHDFNAFSNATEKVAGFYQARSLPTDSGTPVGFLGSTTGSKYDDHVCSPLQVSWNVHPQCDKLDINSLGNWCDSNVFLEDHAHGVRPLVTAPSLLSEIK